MKFNNYVGCRKRRAVAPIIATLLMIAIAVVGGVMIYVFTQGFFKGTSTSTPTTDVLAVTGYDIKSNPVYTYDGTTGVDGVAASATTGLQSADAISIDVKNAATAQLKITAVKVGGIGAAYSGATAAACIGATPLFEVYQSAVWTAATVDAGKPATIIFCYAGATVIPGTSITIDIITSNGAFTSNAIVGQRQ